MKIITIFAVLFNASCGVVIDSLASLDSPSEELPMEYPDTADYPFHAYTYLNIEGDITPIPEASGDTNIANGFGDSTVNFQCLDSLRTESPIGKIEVSIAARSTTGTTTQNYTSSFDLLCAGKIILDIYDIRTETEYNVSVSERDLSGKTIKTGTAKSIKFTDDSNPEAIEFTLNYSQ